MIVEFEGGVDLTEQARGCSHTSRQTNSASASLSCKGSSNSLFKNCHVMHTRHLNNVVIHTQLPQRG